MALNSLLCADELLRNCSLAAADATATPSSLASLKSRMVYLSGAGLHWLSWKRGH